MSEKHGQDHKYFLKIVGDTIHVIDREYVPGYHSPVLVLVLTKGQAKQLHQQFTSAIL